ncbi:MAG: alpha/beta fold hydrolase [Betaproteobacteria bacterium]|nr:alpha/beta fold hydrolase [Betaproteobacteria bacterium]
MTTRTMTVAGRNVAVAEIGKGRPVLYLHGFADVHAGSVGWLPFHETLGESFRVIAPAHPACAGTDEDEGIDTIDDVIFHTLQVMDALGLGKVDIVGTCFGGWIAAELAVRNPERVGRVVLVGASGLMVPRQPIGDLFWQIQPENGIEYKGLRSLLFARADDPAALALFPDVRSDIERGLSQFKAMRFASRVGFKPPYFYHRKLRERLGRFKGEALLIWGESDRMVPRSHAEAYRTGLGGKTTLKIVAGAGHSPHVEKPKLVAGQIQSFLAPKAPSKKAASVTVKSVAKKKAPVAKKRSGAGRRR